jgi:hypothetical protein
MKSKCGPAMNGFEALPGKVAQMEQETTFLEISSPD